MGAPTVHLSRKNMENYHIYPSGGRRASQAVNGALDALSYFIVKEKRAVRDLFSEDELYFMATAVNDNLYYPGGIDDTNDRMAAILDRDAGASNIDKPRLEKKVQDLGFPGMLGLIELLADIREEEYGRS